MNHVPNTPKRLIACCQVHNSTSQQRHERMWFRCYGQDNGDVLHRPQHSSQLHVWFPYFGTTEHQGNNMLHQRPTWFKLKRLPPSARCLPNRQKQYRNAR
jgi:hypothetical protein